MKILLATYWPIPHLGGVWNYMVQLKNKLESLGHEVDLLGYDKDNISVYIVNENRKIDRYSILHLIEAKLNKQNSPHIYANELVKWTEFQCSIYELSAAYLGLEKYDLIHTQDVLSTACINRVRPKETPLVATIHGSVAYEIRGQLTNIHKSDTAYLARAYYDDLERIGATSAEVTITANNWLKNILTGEFLVPDEQIRVLHYGFDTETFIKRMEKKSYVYRPENKRIIIYAGRLTEIKGVHHLISALNDLKKIRNDWICWIVGSGVKSEELRDLTDKLDLEDNVFFLGRRNDVPYLVANSDIFVLPSLIDNQPLSVIEAQIAGKAIIVSDAGGLPEMIEHGVTGLVTPAGNPKMLCNSINQLLNDENYRETLGSNAKKWGMTHWSSDTGIESLIEVYQFAISKRKRDLEQI